METTATTTEVLNDLIEINNDRIQGYNKAINELKDDDQDLKRLFTAMIAESHGYKMALAQEVASAGIDIATGTTGSGKLYRAWMDVKAVFTGHDRETVLANCEGGEDAAQQAYTAALEEELPEYIATMLIDQQTNLKVSHDLIKSLRNGDTTKQLTNILHLSLWQLKLKNLRKHQPALLKQRVR